jgi:hypothetical protein
MVSSLEIIDNVLMHIPTIFYQITLEMVIGTILYEDNIKSDTNQ